MEISPVEVISRVLHIMGAVLLLGGGMFVRNALFPACQELPEELRSQVQDATAKRWRYLVAMAIAILIFSGFYNYLVVMLPKHPGDKLYHMWMGIKILLAFVVFFFASALAGRSKALEGIRRNAGLWMLVTTSLGMVIVVIAAVLKVRGTVR